jgi:hypothetical protein
MIAAFGRRMSSSKGAWPVKDVMRVLEKEFASLERVGEEPGFSVFQANERGVNFALAMAHPNGANTAISELFLLAGFSGYPIDDQQLETVNRALHLSVAQFEHGDLYIMARIPAQGAFNRSKFTMLLEAWRRDLAVLIQFLTQPVSLSAALSQTQFAMAQRAAMNTAAGAGDESLSKRFMGGAPSQLCMACAGRGKVGFAARDCQDCAGRGLVASLRH